MSILPPYQLDADNQTGERIMKYEISSFGATHIVVAVTVKGSRKYRKEIAVATSRAKAKQFIASLA